ncbi:unnamed protein product [Schistocephalus solidus]|uniref:Uncharacterized protein n=1 Tax=Schistocephalus solidus TaxID=70667 RepID=A0A183SJV2_SCHSO|nr:unnamed protein product [Schistocephalus solidus]
MQPRSKVLASTGLYSPPEARSTGRAGNQGDWRSRGLDGSPPRHLSDEALASIPMKAPSNQITQKLEILHASDNNATVETRWCQLRNVIQSSALEVLRRAHRQHQDWFDDNGAAISNLSVEENGLHKAYMDLRTDATKAAFFRCRRLAQQRLREMQDVWVVQKAEDIQGYANRNELKNILKAIKAIYGTCIKGTAPLLSFDGTTLLTDWYFQAATPWATATTGGLNQVRVSGVLYLHTRYVCSLPPALPTLPSSLYPSSSSQHTPLSPPLALLSSSPLLYPSLNRSLLPHGRKRPTARATCNHVDAGYTFYWSGRPRAKQRDAGVAFASQKDIVGCLPCLPQGINDRLMSIRLPLGLCFRPKARQTGRAGVKGDPRCRRVDRSPPRHLQDEASSVTPQKSPSNELANRLANFPVADADICKPLVFIIIKCLLT